MDRQTENPGALAGATGADGTTKAASLRPELSTNAAGNATKLYHETADHILTICAAGSVKWRATIAWAALRTLPDDVAALVIEADSELRGAGPPIPPLSGEMAEAVFWASMASSRELDAYCLACFNMMAPARQSAFLGHVQRRAAA